VVALAALTALSAIRDVAETISDLCEHLVKNGLVILFMLLALAAAFGSYRWARSKEIGPEKD
jgi:hypothetical protein